VFLCCKTTDLKREQKCIDFLDKYSSITNCEKVLFLESQFNENRVSSRCIDHVINDLESITEMKALAKPGIGGYLYKSKNDFEIDILAWKEKLKCKN